ncbi:HGGxSTG domain-containing protein [Tsuneonella sp. CC-YZS046]|uniref:HGGxSTG domain-containing protein n=1 Tax=Tsuneonella sp. CC-YZS046 TaxID=3042152 RepID=UPI003A7F21FF
MPKLLTNAKLCGARNRAGKSCRCPAVRGKARCRMHGGRNPGAPRGKRNGMWKHGGSTREALALRRAATRPCLRCRKPFESEGNHHRLCGACSNRAAETSPYAV